MASESPKNYPVPSIRRLPVYLALLRRLRDSGVEAVSSTRIAQELGLTGIQVRKDLSMTQIVGRPKVGHAIRELIDHIERFLGWDKPRQAFLVGAGHLGTALLGYRGFQQEKLDISAVFDNSPQKIGTTVFDKEILPISEFHQLVLLRQVYLAILTVPAAVAQKTTDMMVEAGIVGIWNFAPIQLNVPPEVIVEDVSLSSSLAVLTQRLSVSRGEDDRK